MTTRLGFGVVLLIIVTGAGACATSEQWREWRAHPSHFASGDHLAFSLRNRGPTPRVTRQDERLAASQSWWGEPVVVRPDQIFEN